MIDQVIRVGCVAVAGGIGALALKRYVPELALVLALATAGAILVMMLSGAAQIADGVRGLLDLAGLEEALYGPVLKVTVIAVLSRLVSQICKDAGEGTIALCCELAGTLASIVVTVPLMVRVVEVIGGLMV